MVSPYAYAGIWEVVGNSYGMPPDKQEEMAMDILVTICNFYKVLPAKVMAKGRGEPYVTIRHISMFFIKEKTGLSYKRMGKMFGGRDHSTCIVSVQLITGQVHAKFDNPIKDDVYKLRKII